MKYSSKAWQCLERICNAVHADPEETYRKGREFLRYYRQACCVPEYILVPEECDAGIQGRKMFLDEMEAACSAGLSEMLFMLEDSHTSPSQLRHLVSETAMRLHNASENGGVYWEILTRKYLSTFQMTDAAIGELMTMSETNFYVKHKEACTYFMVIMANTVLPRMREELLQIEAEERLQPGEVLHG